MPKKHDTEDRCGKDKSRHFPMTRKDSSGKIIRICKKCGKVLQN